MWQGILGHDALAEHFRATLRRGRLASTYLFVGPTGIGKRCFALALAKSLLCQQTADDPLAPCGQCESCRLFDAGNHPDLESLGLPPEKSALPVELFIGDKDHRNREGLCHRIALKPYLGSRKVAIIDDADYFNQESANCLLKTLEEPPPRSLVILIGTSPSRQLPTIRSRSQVLRFSALDRAAVARILVESGLIADQQQASQAAELSEGSVDQALRLADPELLLFRQQIIAELQSSAPDHVRFGRAVQAFVDEAGKEPSRRRDRLRVVICCAVDFYRRELRSQAEGNAEPAIQAIDVSLAALEHIDRNVNQATLISWWLDELSRSPVALA